MLGVMYGEGKGITQNYKTAVKWYTLAAEQGNANAQTLLGFVYSLGEGVIKDYVRAHMWFNIAASSGESKDASKNRDFVAKRMTPSQLEKAQRLARNFVPKKTTPTVTTKKTEPKPSPSPKTGTSGSGFFCLKVGSRNHQSTHYQ